MSAIVEVLRASPALTTVSSGLIGLLIGSFLNVVIYRLPLMMERDWRRHCAELEGREATAEPEFNLVRPRSACPHCQRPIRARENVPVLSWLLLRGRCAGCGGRISARYPLVELATAVASALVAWRFGATVETLAALAFTWALIALALIDYDTQLLPDAITLPLLWLGLLLSVAHPVAGAERLFVSPAAAITGAAAGYLSLWSVYQAFKLATGKEGMGFGDFKLLAALGAWLGWQALPLIIVLSAVVGALVGGALMAFTSRGREAAIPFGPFLAAAGWIALLYGDVLAGLYLDTMGLR